MADNAKQLNSTNQIKFLHGTQAALNTLGIGVANRGTAGTFYFTTDSRRMYLAQKDGTIVPVNDSITSVETIGDLPKYGDPDLTMGSFYYSKAENVLCIWNGREWHQINPDTYNTEKTTTAISGVASTDYTTHYDVTDIVKDNKSKTVESKWALETDGTISLTLSTENISVKDSQNQELYSYNKPIFKFKSTTYLTTVESNTSGKFKLVNAASDSQTITINSDATNGIAITSDNSGNINVNATDLYTKLDNEDIKSLTMGFDASGNLKTTLTRNNKNTTDLIQTLTPTIKYGNGTTLNEATFKNGVAVLEVYNKEEVDSKLQDAKETINAMSYKGVTQDNVSVPVIGTTNLTFYPKDESGNSAVSVGDTWKIGVKERYTKTGKYISTGVLPTNPKEEWARVGDLLIANVKAGTTENTEGFIDANNLIWEYVPSGDDDNNVYSATLLGHGFKITETSENGIPDILNFTLEADEETDQIVLEDTTSDVTSKTKVVKISHATITRSDDSVATAISQDGADVTDYSTVTIVTPVTGITTNNGHITQVHTTPINLIDTNASVKEVDLSVSQDPTDVNKEKATLKTKVTLEHPSQPDAKGDYDEDSVTFTSLNKNIQISTDANGITINLVWGTF